MKFFKISLKYECDFTEFAEFWSSFYKYPNERLYSDRINKRQFTEEDIKKLFEWKNGRPLSQKKKHSLKSITNKLKIINQLKLNFDVNQFKEEFNKISAIWKIYLLHTINPKDYPIFDQHVYRAFYFLANNKINEIPSTNSAKEKIYFDYYKPFFNNLANKGASHKKLDEALWSFGKFLKTDYCKVICSLQT